MAAKENDTLCIWEKNSSDCMFLIRKLGNQKEEDFKVLKENKHQPFILYLPKIFFRREYEEVHSQIKLSKENL